MESHEEMGSVPRKHHLDSSKSLETFLLSGKERRQGIRSWESSLPSAGQNLALPPQPSPSCLTVWWQADQNNPAKIFQFNYF